MNAGKTTTLLQSNYNYLERGMSTLLFAPRIDNRYGIGKITSRIGLEANSEVFDMETDLFTQVKEKHHHQPIHCVLIDEAQFLTAQQVDELYLISKIYDISVLCYGLRTDFRTNGFEGSTRLLEIADDIEELKTICACGKKATFNIRKMNGMPMFDGEQILIDGTDKIEYEAVCGKCLIKQKGRVR